jgi:hypothetical protein
MRQRVHEGGLPRRWLKVKQKGWTVEEDRCRRVQISDRSNGRAVTSSAEMNDQSRRNLFACLGFLQLKPTEPELRLLHRSFDHWRGIGVLAAALYRVGYDLTLIRQSDQGWHAAFHVTGHAHSIIGGWANDPKPWRAVQRAAWDAVRREADCAGGRPRQGQDPAGHGDARAVQRQG